MVMKGRNIDWKMNKNIVQCLARYTILMGIVKPTKGQLEAICKNVLQSHRSKLSINKKKVRLLFLHCRDKLIEKKLPLEPCVIAKEMEDR